jgi:hypothetical protein
MTQYHFLDDSGDPGLSGAAGSSSHFVLVMVQLPERAPLVELTLFRQMFHLSLQFEIKHYKTKLRHRQAFFQIVQALPFRARAVVIDKAHVVQRFSGARGHDLAIEYAAQLTLRAKPLDLASDVLIVDDAPPSFMRALRIYLSRESRARQRVRPFSKMVSGDSGREDGLQLADMVAGAIRHHYAGDSEDYLPHIMGKIVDLWEV